MLSRHTSIAFMMALSAFLPNTVFAQQYTNLLAGDLSHWTASNGDAVASGWQLEPGGILHLSGKGGNIISKEQYGDFELWFEFRISTKGNSGIKYRVQHYDKSLLGLEYQVLDDAAYPKLSRSHLTASLYDLVELIPSETRLNGLEEFSVGKIRVQGNRTQHWINGQLTVDQSLIGPEWKAIVANSKFKDRENFGENNLGHLMLTDHGSEVWYRNIYVRRLNAGQCP